MVTTDMKKQKTLSQEGLAAAFQQLEQELAIGLEEESTPISENQCAPIEAHIDFYDDPDIGLWSTLSTR